MHVETFMAARDYDRNQYWRCVCFAESKICGEQVVRAYYAGKRGKITNWVSGEVRLDGRPMTVLRRWGEFNRYWHDLICL
jgi:hypothetical protein